jgi:murein DD-endopeptidase MepM/ murein hydrolase activator NlpD
MTKMKISFLALILFFFAGIQANNTLPFNTFFIDSVKTKNLENKEVDMPFWVGLHHTYGKIKSNQVFSSLLREKGCNSKTIQAITSNTDVFNVGKITSGTEYCFISSTINDSVTTPRYLVYNEDVASYVVFDLQDENTKVTRYQRPVEVRERIATGIVEGSLWETFDKNNINPVIASQLADVFAYTINFFKVRKDDKFKIIYNEKLINGVSVEVTDIKAVSFQYHGKEYYAFAHEHDGKVDYLDEDGKSMKMRFLMAPVKFSRISSKYNTHRLHPVTGKVKGHFGTDFAASHGAPIYATADGVVSEARFKQYNGNYVKIRHDKTYETQYLHMSKIAKGMRPGSKVRQGDIIGYVGSTGLATGPHVCYRFWKNGKQVDPFKEPDAKAMLLNAAEQKEFVAKIKEIRKDLDAMAYGESKSKELTASVK